MEAMAIMMVTFSVAFAITMVVVHLLNSCSTNIVYNEGLFDDPSAVGHLCSCLMMMTLTLKAAFLGIPMIPICCHHIGALSQNLALKESGPDACSLNCVSLKRLREAFRMFFEILQLRGLTWSHLELWIILRRMVKGLNCFKLHASTSQI